MAVLFGECGLVNVGKMAFGEGLRHALLRTCRLIFCGVLSVDFVQPVAIPFDPLLQGLLDNALLGVGSKVGEILPHR